MNCLYITALFQNHYFKMTIFSQVVLFIFLLARVSVFFRKDFQRNLQDSIQMADIAKRNWHVHVILGNTGHTWRRPTVKLAGAFYV